MHPIVAFFSGLFSFGASFGLACKEQRDIERQAAEDAENRYSYAAQSRYDFDRRRLYTAYNIEKVMACVREDYPRMSDLAARQVGEAAIAKHLLETETNYRYKPSDNCKFFNLDKYIKEEFKRKPNER